MGKRSGRRRSMQQYWLIIILCFFFVSEIHADKLSNQPAVKLHVTNKQVELDNGIVKLTLLKPSGMITSVGYQRINNILEYRLRQTRRGYWDMVWDRPGRSIRRSHYDTMYCTNFKVVAETDDQIEVSFTKKWNVSLGRNLVPLNIDKRYIVRRGVSGFYSYAIFEHLEGWPALNIGEARIVFKLHQNMFREMAISDDKQRVMPSDRDRRSGRVLDFKEAVLLTRAGMKGDQVDDKYQYSCDSKDNHVHGWISSNPALGFWVITPSDEFRGGGPVKQDLTSHASSTSLAMFFSGHYADRPAGVRLQNGEAWKKVLGPVFIYLNSGLGLGSGSGSGSRNDSSVLWQDANRQMLEETKKWPYDFPMSTDFARANQRGAITGQLLVRDSGIIAARAAYVGLSPPGDVGCWQYETKGYQFWTQTNATGHYMISSVRAGTYNLYAWVPGFIGDFKHDADIVIRPGSKVGIGKLLYDPPRNGPTLWEIGIPDRSAAEFYIPDPPPALANKLFSNHTEKYRQYGLWERYSDLYPNQDLIYTVGISDYRKDWFFAHVNRRVDKNYRPTTWKIVFDARNVMKNATYTLRLALASAHYANIQVWMNRNPNGYPYPPHFKTGRIGKDNAIARHGIHGHYRLYSVEVSGTFLVDGTNTIYLKQSQGSSPFNGVLYDYIRLEAPPLSYN